MSETLLHTMWELNTLKPSQEQESLPKWLTVLSLIKKQGGQEVT